MAQTKAAPKEIQAIAVNISLLPSPRLTARLESEWPRSATSHYRFHGDKYAVPDSPDFIAADSQLSSFVSIRSLHQACLQSIFHHGILKSRCAMQIVGINKLCTRPRFGPPANSDTADEAGVLPLTNHYPALSRVERSLITNFHSQIATFLIDTLPIRIMLNSLRITACITSNRHSPEPLCDPKFAGVNL